MTTCKIKLVSPTNAAALIVTLLTVFIGGVILIIPHGLHNSKLAMLIAVGLMIVAYFLWQRFVTGRTEWTLNDNEISIAWTKKFPFTEGKEISFRWDEVKNISKGLDPQYYNLKIELVSGQTIKFYHDNLTTRDDFEECLKVLLQTLNAKRLQPHSID